MQHNEAFLAAVRNLSEAIVQAQRPIRVLEAIKWDGDIKADFLKHGGRRLPQVDADYYRQQMPLGFDAEAKQQEFRDIERRITRELGAMTPVARLMRRHCQEYRQVVDMLQRRGTPAFSQMAQELYGAASDVFHAGEPTIADMGETVERTIDALLAAPQLREAPRTIPAAKAVDHLNDCMQRAFPDAGIRVMLSDGIVADAAAGTDYIKIREDASFNQSELDILEAHEGWVHLGTTLNGAAQPYCRFLSKGPPSATVTQEGLAVLTEVLSMRSSPRRLKKLVSRVRAVAMAEEGADLCEVFAALRAQDMSEDEAWTLASRVFRGSTPDGGPFTKDLTYLKGFVMIFNLLRLAITEGRLQRLPLLFCGKTVLEDMPILAELHDQGLVSSPQHLPPQFRELDGLVAFFSFSRFMHSLSFPQLESDYAHLL